MIPTQKLLGLVLFLLLITNNLLPAQDLIATKEGDSLNCKITKVETDYIYFSIAKDGGVLNTLLPMQQVHYYKYKFYTASELPADAKVEGPKDFPRWRLAINGGWSLRLAKVIETNSSSQTDYLRELKSGYAYGADVTYFWSKKSGIGAKYDVYRSKNEYYDISGPLLLSDDISITYIGPYYSSRFLTSNKKNSLFMNLGLGYVGYKDDAFVLNSDLLLTGGTAGLLVEVGYDFGLSKSFAMGIQVSLIGGTLTQYKIDDGFNTQTIELNEDEYEGLGRINISVGLRLIK